MTIEQSLYAIRCFVRAAEYEYEREQLDHPYFEIEGAMRQVPRVIMLRSPKRYATFVTAFLPIGRVVWALLGAPALFVAQYIRLLAASLWVPTAKLDDVSSVYLGSSNSINLNCVVPRPKHFPEVLVVSPFRGIVTPSTAVDVPRIGLLEIVSAWTLLKALLAAIVVNWMLLSAATRRCSLWGYTAFQWFVTYFAISSSSLRYVWVSNHFDRWTVLAESVTGASAIIVQHGGLSQQIGSTTIEYEAKVKLSNICEIYYLDVAAVRQFSLFVDTTNTIFTKMVEQVCTGPWRDLEKRQTKVLILGSSGSLKLYERMTEAIAREFKDAVDIAIRHHPLQRRRLRREIADSVGLWELSSDDPIPLADIVVSYGSSLDAQIAEHTCARILNYRWTANNNLDSVCEVVNQGISSIVNRRAGVKS